MNVMEELKIYTGIIHVSSQSISCPQMIIDLRTFIKNPKMLIRFETFFSIPVSNNMTPLLLNK